jgi:hypothetical protein
MKDFILRIHSFLLSKLIKTSPPKSIQESSENVFNKFEAYSDSFFSFHLRPKKSADYTLTSFGLHSEFLVAMVIQGPIVEKDNFTIESIRIYKKNFEKTIIILSTWNDQNPQLISEIEKEGVTVVLSPVPENAGPLNINFQIISARAGIEKAKELGISFVYKTRCDQRIYGTNLNHAFIELLKNYPIQAKYGLKYRLLSPNFTTLKFRPYGISDMVMFGQIDDMLIYWDALLDKREKNIKFDSNVSISDYAKLRLAETYLCTTFLDKIDYSYNFTLSDSWNVYRDIFIIVDHSILDLFWNKYETHIEKRFDYYSPHSYQLMKFTDWLALQGTYEINEIANESILMTIEGHRISNIEK